MLHPLIAKFTKHTNTTQSDPLGVHPAVSASSYFLSRSGDWEEFDLQKIASCPPDLMLKLLDAAVVH